MSSKKNRRHDRAQRATQAVQNGIVVERLGRHAQALGAADLAKARIEEVAHVFGNTPDACLAGRLAEELHAGHFNIDAAMKGRTDLTAYTTASRGAHQAAADIHIEKAGKVASEVQSKYCNRSVRATFEISDPKYDGMQKIVAEGQADTVRRLAQKRGVSGTGQRNYGDTAARVNDRMSLEGVQSRPVSYEQATQAAKSPSSAANALVHEQMGKAVVGGGMTAAAVGGGISLIQNSLAVANGEKDAGEAAFDVLVTTTEAGVTGAAVATVTVGAQQLFTQVGGRALAGGAGPAAVAVTAVDVLKDTGRALSGDISGEEFASRTAVNVAKGGATWAGAEAGALLGTAICPGVGTIVGGILGGIAGGLAVDEFFSLF